MSIKAWSDQDEKQLIFLYTEDDLKDVHELANIFGKGYRSVISKLVQLKIYEKPNDKEQTPNKTVKMMLRELEEILEIEIEGVNLNKKENLKSLLDAVLKKVS
tara:strand:- start:18928 stop:19236 length:309 start_codon:yes stop_codon:yes gene_type:complete